MSVRSGCNTSEVAVLVKEDQDRLRSDAGARIHCCGLFNRYIRFCLSEDRPLRQQMAFKKKKKSVGLSRCPPEFSLH